MRGPVVGAFVPKRRRHRHLRHHRGAAAPDKALVGEQHMPRPGPRRGDRGVHASAAGADDQYIALEMGRGSVDHAPGFTP
jgi:hypothetical protein